jgi:hypothetical protein
MKSQNFISKLENLINSSYSDNLNPLIKSNNEFDLYQQKKLQSSYSTPKYLNSKNSTLSINTSGKKENFLFNSINSNFNNTVNSKTQLKRINFLSPHSKSFSTLKKMIEESPNKIIKKGLINPYNKPNKFSIGNTSQEDIQHQIEEFTKELKKKNNGSSYINRPISSFYNFHLNNYSTPFQKNRLKHIIKAETISRIFNNSNRDFFQNKNSSYKFKKNTKYYFVPENKKLNSDKVIDNFMREFNENKTKGLFQTTTFRKSQSTHSLNLNF